MKQSKSTFVNKMLTSKNQFLQNLMKGFDEYGIDLENMQDNIDIFPLPSKYFHVNKRSIGVDHLFVVKDLIGDRISEKKPGYTPKEIDVICFNDHFCFRTRVSEFSYKPLDFQKGVNMNTDMTGATIFALDVHQLPLKNGKTPKVEENLEEINVSEINSKGEVINETKLFIEH